MGCYFPAVDGLCRGSRTGGFFSAYGDCRPRITGEHTLPDAEACAHPDFATDQHAGRDRRTDADRYIGPDRYPGANPDTCSDTDLNTYGGTHFYPDRYPGANPDTCSDTDLNTYGGTHFYLDTNSGAGSNRYPGTNRSRAAV